MGILLATTLEPAMHVRARAVDEIVSFPASKQSSSASPRMPSPSTHVCAHPDPLAAMSTSGALSSCLGYIAGFLGGAGYARATRGGHSRATNSLSPTPALKSPPRRNIPGRDEAPDPPKQLLSPPGRASELVQSVQLESETSPQSATISSTFPTLSKTPHADLQFDRDPVLTGCGELPAQSVVPLSVPGSGVPAAAPCHSRFVSSRFPDRRHA